MASSQTPASQSTINIMSSSQLFDSLPRQLYLRTWEARYKLEEGMEQLSFLHPTLGHCKTNDAVLWAVNHISKESHKCAASAHNLIAILEEERASEEMNPETTQIVNEILNRYYMVFDDILLHWWWIRGRISRISSMIEDLETDEEEEGHDGKEREEAGLVCGQDGHEEVVKTE